jgi:hypothetical protein
LDCRDNGLVEGEVEVEAEVEIEAEVEVENEAKIKKVDSGVD